MLLCRVITFLAPTTLGRGIARSLVFLKAVSVSAWSEMIGLLREPDYWIPWDILSSIFVMLGGGRSFLPVDPGCPEDREDGSFPAIW